VVPGDNKPADRSRVVAGRCVRNLGRVVPLLRKHSVPLAGRSAA